MTVAIRIGRAGHAGGTLLGPSGECQRDRFRADQAGAAGAVMNSERGM